MERTPVPSIRSFATTVMGALVMLCLTATPLWAAGDNGSSTADQVKTKQIPIDQRIFTEDWNDVPFDTKYFTYTDQQMKAQWGHLMRGLRAPWPSRAFIAHTIQQYPGLYKGVDPALLKDPAAMQKKTLEVWRLFLAGQYQQAWRQGNKLGAMGELPGRFSELLYAMYLADHKSVKDMFLQDVMNALDNYRDPIERMENSNRKDVREFTALLIHTRAYALARIAEEAPVSVSVARGYIRKLKTAGQRVVKLVPDHPLGLTFLAGVDAGIMRRVGKFAGRLTYGARTTTVQDAFDKALDLAPDIPVLQYEYANALIYMNRKRELNLAMRHLEKATRLRPSFAMEALGSMYAYKRLQEIRLYALNYRSFREFEKDRFNFMDVTDRNLMSVLSPPLTMDMLKHPEKYKLPPQK